MDLNPPNLQLPPHPVARGTEAAPAPAKGREYILLVDDNARNRQAMLRFLGGRGYSLLVAASGEAALAVAAESRPAVILLDVMMPPGIDGFETCRRLKADSRTADAAVIFLSAAGETDQKLTGFAAGGVDYITKPIRGAEVVARVDTHLTIRRLNRELQAKVAEIERELSVVQEMQRRLLPPRLPDVPSLELASYYSTSRYAGGDYYDVVPLSGDRWGVLVADVSGHGTPAAVMMAMIRTFFHAHPALHEHPAGVLRGINDHFRYQWEEVGFVTGLYGVYDAPARALRFACAGHPRPVVWRAATGAAEAVACCPTFPLLIDAIDDMPVMDVAFDPGDRVLFYTDGVVERMGAGGEFFGVPRLEAAVRAARGEGAAEAVGRIIAAVDAFADGRESADDQTLLLGVVR